VVTGISDQDDVTTDGAGAPRGSGEGGPGGGTPAVERMVFFSDAVVAIALTLLALELPVPAGGSDAEVWHSFREKVPEYVMFLLSFAVIAAMWTSHHWLFRYVAGWTRRLMWLNFSWLLGIVLVPFVTKLLIELSGRQLSAVAYGSVVGGASLTMLRMQHHCRVAGLLTPSASPLVMRHFRVRTTFPTVAFLASIPLAFVNPDLAMYSWPVASGVTALAGRVLLRRGRHAVTGPHPD